MPWCENKMCNKFNLRPNEIVFDERNRRVLCIPCGLEATENGDLQKEDVAEKTWFGIGYYSDQGLKAELIYGGTKLALNVTNEQFMRLLGQ